MADRYHTVILVPHTRAKLRKWRLSVVQLRIAASVLLAVTLAAGFITWSYFRTHLDAEELQRLRQENENLRQVNQSFETSIRKLQEDLGTYEERTRQLAIVAGLESLAGATGIGGDGTPAFGTYEGYLDAMSARAGQLGQSLSLVEHELEERQRWIASTPAISPVRGIRTSNFGYRRDPITGKRAFHPAIDISAPIGQPVQAPADGVVLRAGRIGGLGKAVYISHGFGITTRYGHLSRIDVEPGQHIERGQEIGAVGSTGRSTGHHLHYEVWLDGKPVNPLGYILDRTARR
jgi:murein DD-endopeptidase MepM/ murein hydrolase activator NlpD